MKSKIKDFFDEIRGKKVYRRYRERESKRIRLAGQIFSIFLIISILYYLIWCILNANWKVWYMFIPFITTETVLSFLIVLTIMTMWNKRYHPEEGVTYDKEEFSVDIFITLMNEPLEIIENTLKNAVLIEYENKKIYLLDDGNREDVKNLAKKYGVNYIARPTHENRKAGNLNYGLSKTNGDLILALDADQVPDRDILKKTVGYFKYPYIAFVQTKQRFIVPENDPWDNTDIVFYESMQPAKNYDNASFSCGSGVIYRRKALEDIGGFSTWNLVEDLHTSINFHDKGWKSVYHNYAYTTGTAPNDVLSILKQRWQWAVDTMRIFFWDNPLKRKGLNFYQKIQYLHIGVFYIAFGIFLPVLFVLPIWSLFTYKFILDSHPLSYIFARLPYLILQTIAYELIMERKHRFRSFSIKAGLFPAFFDAVVTALLSRNKIPNYTVTSKRALKPGLKSTLFRTSPHLILLTLAFVAPIYGLITIKNDFWFLFVNISWCIWVISALFPFVKLSFVPKDIKNESLQVRYI